MASEASEGEADATMYGEGRCRYTCRQLCPEGTSYHATEGKDKSEWKCDLIQPSSHGSDLKEWRGGYRLGSLIQILTSAYAEGKTTERVTIVRDYIDQVTNFHPRVNRVQATTWIGVFRKLCDLEACLRCENASDGSLHLQTTDDVTKTCMDDGCKMYSYTCKR